MFTRLRRNVNSIATIPLTFIGATFVISAFGVLAVHAGQRAFIGPRKVNNAIEKAARIDKILDSETSEESKVDRIQQTLELGFDDTAAYLVQRIILNRNDSDGKPGTKIDYLVTQHSDFHQSNLGPLAKRDFDKIPELVWAKSIAVDAKKWGTPGRGSGYRKKINGVWYHFTRVSVGLGGNHAKEVWLITNLDKAAAPIYAISQQWLLITTVVNIIGWSVHLFQVGTTLFTARTHIDNDRLAPLPVFANKELKDLWGQVIRYSDGQHKAQAIADESQHLNRAVIDGIQGALIFVKNERLEYVLANSAITDVAGMPLVGKTDFDLPWKTSDAVRYQADDKEVLESGTKGPFLEELSSNGETQHYQTVKSLITVDGAPHVLGVSSNVTELIKAQRLSAKQQGTLRHDIKAFAMSVYNMLKESKDAPSIEVNNQAIKSLGSLLDIIEQTKDFGISTKAFELEHHTPKEIVDTVRSNYALQNVIFTQEDGVTIPVNLAYMARVLNNLIENGFKYNTRLPDDQKKVTVSFRAQGEKGAFCVEDNGDGMKERVLDKIFQSGSDSRVHPNYKEIDGTGYGLGVVADIMEAHGATYKVKSTEGKGSRFYLIFNNLKTLK